MSADAETTVTVTPENIRELHAGGRRNFYAADLGTANLYGADLSFADLRDVTMDWNSHELIGERIRQAATQIWQKQVAAFVLAGAREDGWCWDFYRENMPKDWLEYALNTMAPWVKDGDGAPEILRERVVTP